MFGKFIFRSLAFIAAMVLATSVTQALSIETVSIGDPGNAGELSGGIGLPPRSCGSVDHVYLIGKYEITNSQYVEFLNAVADDDPNNLYNTDMGSGWNDIGGIVRSGFSGSYTYTTRPNRGNRPVNYVSLYDAFRFANWLHNGQPTGVQDASTTEDGAYDMSLGDDVIRKPGARFFLTSEDEWYKAAYYKSGGTNSGYWDYPTQSDTPPTAQLPPGTDLVNGSANYQNNGYLDPTHYTTEVGAYNTKPSTSAYGTFDQAGNLFEWTQDPYYGLKRCVRGGSFYHSGDDEMHASFRLYGTLPTTESYLLGFRIACVPEPSILVLVVIGAVGLLCKREKPWRK